MRPSTLIELAGFGCLTAAGFMWCTIAGLVTAALCLLAIGYATEDAAASVAMVRLTAPLAARNARRKARRAAKRRHELAS